MGRQDADDLRPVRAVSQYNPNLECESCAALTRERDEAVRLRSEVYERQGVILKALEEMKKAPPLDDELRELLVHYFEQHWRTCCPEPINDDVSSCNAALRLRDALVARGIVKDAT